MSEHTPGKWFVSEGSGGYVSDDVRTVRIEAAPTKQDPMGWTVAVVLGDGPPMEANAALIAAAPALLEALKTARTLIADAHEPLSSIDEEKQFRSDWDKEADAALIAIDAAIALASPSVGESK